MIKTCFIISGFSYSGAEIVLYRYLENNKSINPYFIILYDKPDVINKFIEIYGENRVYSLKIKHSKNILRFAPWKDMKKIENKIVNIVNIINPDIIYSNNTMESMLVSKFVEKSKVPSVAHIHDMKNSINSVIRRCVTQNSLKVYDKVITVSNATKKQWNLEDIHVIYNGLDKSYFKDSDKNKYSEGIKNIGFLGTISKRKGVDILLKSLESIISMGLNVHIAYSNIEDNRIYNDILNMKSIYGEKISIYKNLNSNSVIDFYDSIDLLVVPSRHDPLPTVVLESMARRTITLGSNIDGIPEMIKDERLLINNNDDFIYKLKYICSKNKEELQLLSESQYEYCKSKFINEIKVKKINNLINSI